MLGPIGFAWPIAWWILAGSMLHFALDVWEYGIRLNPFRDHIYGFRHIPSVGKMIFRDYLRTYFTDWRFLAAEIASAIVAAALLALRLA